MLEEKLKGLDAVFPGVIINVLSKDILYMMGRRFYHSEYQDLVSLVYSCL